MLWHSIRHSTWHLLFWHTFWHRSWRLSGILSGICFVGDSVEDTVGDKVPRFQMEDTERYKVGISLGDWQAGDTGEKAGGRHSATHTRGQAHSGFQGSGTLCLHARRWRNATPLLLLIEARQSPAVGNEEAKLGHKWKTRRRQVVMSGDRWVETSGKQVGKRWATSGRTLGDKQRTSGGRSGRQVQSNWETIGRQVGEWATTGNYLGSDWGRASLLHGPGCQPSWLRPAWAKRTEYDLCAPLFLLLSLSSCLVRSSLFLSLRYPSLLAQQSMMAPVHGAKCPCAQPDFEWLDVLDSRIWGRPHQQERILIV